MKWQDQASCSGIDTEIFFAADDFTHPELSQMERYRLNLDNRLRVEATCSACPVRQQCLEFAVTNGIMDGIWGGRTADQRKVTGKRKEVAGVMRYKHRGPLTEAEDRMVSEVRGGATFDQVADRHGTTADAVRALVRKGLAAQVA